MASSQKVKEPKSNSERQAALKKKRLDAGLVRVEVYATKENAVKIRDFARGLYNAT